MVIMGVGDFELAGDIFLCGASMEDIGDAAYSEGRDISIYTCCDLMVTMEFIYPSHFMGEHAITDMFHSLFVPVHENIRQCLVRMNMGHLNMVSVGVQPGALILKEV